MVAAWDSSGNLIGVSGYGDDAPVTPFTAFGEGYYAAFVTNDPANTGGGVTSLDDTNDRVMITSIGVGPNRSVEVVQGIITRDEIFPSVPPATITLLGPMPGLRGRQQYAQGIHRGRLRRSGHSRSVRSGGGHGRRVRRGPTPSSGSIGIRISLPGSTRARTRFADLTDPNEETLIGSGYGTIDPMWTDCLALESDGGKRPLGRRRRLHRPGLHLARSVAQSCHLRRRGLARGAPAPGGEGLLLVTGTLDFHGRANWHGLVFAIGEGIFVRSGAGNGTISGATIVADIAGPDDIYGTAGRLHRR